MRTQQPRRAGRKNGAGHGVCIMAFPARTGPTPVCSAMFLNCVETDQGCVPARCCDQNRTTLARGKDQVIPPHVSDARMIKPVSSRGNISDALSRDYSAVVQPLAIHLTLSKGWTDACRGLPMRPL